MMTTSTRNMLFALKPEQIQETQVEGTTANKHAPEHPDIGQPQLQGAPSLSISELMNRCLSQNKSKNTPLS